MIPGKMYQVQALFQPPWRFPWIGQHCSTLPGARGDVRCIVAIRNLLLYDAAMKRIAVVLPDDLAALLDLERRRRDTSIAEIVREALETYLRAGAGQPKRLRFVALGRSGHHDTAQEAETILAREWGRAGDR